MKEIWQIKKPNMVIFIHQLHNKWLKNTKAKHSGNMEYSRPQSWCFLNSTATDRRVFVGKLLLGRRSAEISWGLLPRNSWSRDVRLSLIPSSRPRRTRSRLRSRCTPRRFCATGWWPRRSPRARVWPLAPAAPPPSSDGSLRHRGKARYAHVCIDAFYRHCIQGAYLHLITSCFPWESNSWPWRCKRRDLPFI